MNNIKKYIPAILVIALALILSGIYFLRIGKSAGQDFLSLPEGAVLTEDQKTKYNEAIGALKQNPQDAQALVKVAQVKYAIMDLEGSEKVYLKALEIMPNDTLILNNLGDIYNQLQDYPRAEEMYLKLIEINPKWLNAYRELKSIYKFHLKEEYPSLEGILLRGLQESQEFGGEGKLDFYSMLAVFYKDTNQKEKAIEYYEKVLELDPSNQGARIDLEALLR